MAKVQQLFSRDLALANDYLRQENQILRGKLGSRAPLTEADRRILVQYGLRIKERLAARAFFSLQAGVARVQSTRANKSRRLSCSVG
jgi:hypothetical protein